MKGIQNCIQNCTQNCIQNQKDKKDCTNGITPLIYQAIIRLSVRPHWSIRLPYFYLFIVVVKGHMHICPKKRKEGRGHAGLESGKGGREREGRERGRGLGVDCSYIYMRDEFPSNLNKIAAKKHWVSCI